MRERFAGLAVPAMVDLIRLELTRHNALTAYKTAALTD